MFSGTGLNFLIPLKKDNLTHCNSPTFLRIARLVSGLVAALGCAVKLAGVSDHSADHTPIGGVKRHRQALLHELSRLPCGHAVPDRGVIGTDRHSNRLQERALGAPDTSYTRGVNLPSLSMPL